MSGWSVFFALIGIGVALYGAFEVAEGREEDRARQREQRKC